MFWHVVAFVVGNASGYFIPSLVKKWLANADKFVQDVEKKL